MMSALVSFVHFAAVFGIVAALAVEWVTLTQAPSQREARRLQRCDLGYGVSAGVLLAAGLLRVFYFDKGSAFYAGNPFFWLKLALFAAVGLLSVYPTLRFLRWRAQTRTGRSPVLAPGEYRALRVLIGLELALLPAIALYAALMARGIGS